MIWGDFTGWLLDNSFTTVVFIPGFNFLFGKKKVLIFSWMNFKKNLQFDFAYLLLVIVSDLLDF